MSLSCSTKIIHFSAECKRPFRRPKNHFVRFLPVLLAFCQKPRREQHRRAAGRGEPAPPHDASAHAIPLQCPQRLRTLPIPDRKMGGPPRISAAITWATTPPPAAIGQGRLPQIASPRLQRPIEPTEKNKACRRTVTSAGTPAHGISVSGVRKCSLRSGSRCGRGGSCALLPALPSASRWRGKRN